MSVMEQAAAAAAMRAASERMAQAAANLERASLTSELLTSEQPAVEALLTELLAEARGLRSDIAEMAAILQYGLRK